MKSLSLLLVAALSMVITNASPITTPGAGAPFATQLLSSIAESRINDNIIVSPVSLQTCLALTFLGAEGNTANELQRALQLSSSDKVVVAQQFNKIIERSRSIGSAKLSMVNRIYLANQFELSSKYNELAQQYFYTQAENVNFAESRATADKINAVIESETENKIRNVLSADNLDGETAAVLVNAIYFRAKWEKNFNAYATKKKAFSLSKSRQVNVDMMMQEDTFLYAELKELNATAVEMAYRDTDIRMMVILPGTIDGLELLERKLQNIDLIQIAERLNRQRVRIEMPRFKIEFEVSLQPVLEQLGMRTMFTPAADLNGMLAKARPLSISEVKQKAIIEIDEEGTEAAATTHTKAVLESLATNEAVRDFVMDRPFVFALKDKENVYFVGHVAKL